MEVSYPTRYRGCSLILIPLLCLGRKVTLGSNGHLFSSAIDILISKMVFVAKPVILVPTNKEPNVLGPIKILENQKKAIKKRLHLDIILQARFVYEKNMKL